jgi:hypothetical protein
MFGRTTLTPSNAAIVLTTSFEADLEARPSACGRNVFFATKFGRFTGIREFFTEGGTDINDTRPITSHVKEYLVGNIRHLSSTSNYDTLLVHTTEETNVVYLYQFIWQDQSKVQSAWSRWEFDSAVVHSFFDQQDIYLVIQRTDGYYLHRLSLDAVDEDDLTYHVHLAAKFDVDDVNTQFILPFGWLANANMIAVQGAGCPNPGLPVRITNIVNVPGEGQVVTLHDDMEGGHIVVGVRFNSEYWPTMPRVTDGSGDVISNARLQINQFITSLETTGHIIGQKMTKWGNGPEVEFEGWIVNAANSVIGSPALDDFSFQLPYKERADRGEIRFFTDKHWPMTMLDIEWEGTVNKRGKRITTGARQQ